MAYVAPTTRSTGYVVPASTWNSDVVDNVIALKALIDAITTGWKYPCDGRLTLTTGTPVTTADVTAATTLYWAPYRGNQLALYSGSAWVMFSQAQLSIAVPATTNQMYDVFIDYNSGTPALSLTAWTNDTTRATALTTQDGVLVLTGSTGKRFVGCMRTTGVSGQTEVSAAKCLVANYYHQLPRTLWKGNTGNYAYTTATWREANGGSNRVEFIVPFAEYAVSLRALSTPSNGTSAVSMATAIGLDTTTAPTANSANSVSGVGAAYTAALASFLDVTPAVGYHYAARLEYSDASGTTTWYDSAKITGQQSGIGGVTLG